MIEEMIEAQHVYGNFQSYYNFHPARARSALFPENLFSLLWKAQGCPEVFTIFDIGCNEGDLTLLLLRLAREQLPDDASIEVVGVDIDSNLIERANKKSVDLLSSMENVKAEFVAADFMLDNSESLGRFSGKMHFVSLFSVTMWVHLNHGDVGLRSFFDRACDLLTATGVLVVEPQSRKSYKNARKRALKLQLPEPKHWGSIALKNPEQDIDDICKERDFASILYLGKEMWERSLSIYSNVSLPSLKSPMESKKRSGGADEGGDKEKKSKKVTSLEEEV